MMLLCTFQAMKKRQLFWTAFCVLSLLENHVSADETTTSGKVSPVPTTTVKATTNTKMLTGIATTAKVLTTAVPPVPENSTSEDTAPKNTSSTHIPPVSTVSMPQISPTQGNESHAARNETTETLTTVKSLTSSSNLQTKTEVTTSSNTIRAKDSQVQFTCMNIKEVKSTNVICLELNGSSTCEQFIDQKSKHLGKVLCAANDTCHIKLTKSALNSKCILLVGVNDKGTDALDTVIADKRRDLQEVGITTHKQEDIESHKDYSRKTLIALVTSGLLLAFLGLAGYHLMKRRSWSPMGERLGEDPYYTENGSHGTPAISVASHEQSNLQEKPNLNGGARENGTGQPASKNGHSTKPHVVADTEL
ncbi:hematopoietic progenitor cell antigen CD34 [Anolis carolinensis]|uniref:hematopoietic progenitor cell antigen CD34 n=1 Tax=Anolis carolinensis TaxID=28377 RepID=UPI002F2B72A5